MAARDHPETDGNGMLAARLDTIIGQQARIITMLENFAALFESYRPAVDKAARTLDSPTARFARTWGGRG